MHICFATRLTEHLGIQLLSAVCKQHGHTVSHVFDPGLESAGVLPGEWLPAWLNTDDRTVQAILDTGAAIVGFNVEINTFSWTVELAQKLKARRPEIIVAVGGVHATTVPAVVMEFDCFDYLCVGEGDEALPELLARLDADDRTDDIGNIWARQPDGSVVENAVRPLLKSLDDLPFFDKSIHYDLVPEMSHEYHTNTSRGCVYSCSFCFYQPIQQVYGGRFRNMRSPEHVCRELEEAVARYPSIRTVTFHDEVFTANRRWLREFAALWPKRVGLPFSIITHPDLVDAEIAALHKRKTTRYAEIVAGGGLSLRPGVADLIANARARGIAVAVATTTNRPNVDALCVACWNRPAHEVFDVIAAGDEVRRKKPAPDVFLLALARLNLPSHACIAFEDSRNGLRSAQSAGLRTVVTPSAYTAAEDFSAADWVLPSLECGRLPVVLTGPIARAA